MKSIIVIIFILFISGCSLLPGIAEKGAAINDESLINAEFVICSAASTGAIQRRYNTKELLSARKVICDSDNIVVLP